MNGVTVRPLTIGVVAEMRHRPPGLRFAVLLRGHGLTEAAALANLEAQIRGYGQSSGVDLRDSLPPDLRG